MPLPPVNPEGFAKFNPHAVFDKEHFLAGLAIILDYFNASNTPSELDDIHTRSLKWCKTYYANKTFHHRPPINVLETHPNVFNFSIKSWERLEKNTSHGGNSMDTDTAFPTYTEPSLLDDAVIYDLVDSLAIEQSYSMDLCEEDTHTSIRAPLQAENLKDTTVIFHIPEMLANLANLNIAAIVAPHLGLSFFYKSAPVQDTIQYTTAMSVEGKPRRRSSMSIDEKTDYSSRTMSLDSVFDSAGFLTSEYTMTTSDESWQTCLEYLGEDAMAVCSIAGSDVDMDMDMGFDMDMDVDMDVDMDAKDKGEGEEFVGSAMEGVVRTQSFGNIQGWLGSTRSWLHRE